MNRPYPPASLSELSEVSDFGIRLTPAPDVWEWFQAESAESLSLYEANYEAAGFYRVDRPQRGDMIVMEVGRTAHPNHAGIFLGTDPSL